jgi:hypothetical protein
MEISQGNSLHSYLKQKYHFFLLQNQRKGGQNKCCLGVCEQCFRVKGR